MTPHEDEKPRDEAEPRVEDESSQQDLSKETLADLDASEDPAEDVKGGRPCYQS